MRRPKLVSSRLYDHQHHDARPRIYWYSGRTPRNPFRRIAVEQYELNLSRAPFLSKPFSPSRKTITFHPPNLAKRIVPNITTCRLCTLPVPVPTHNQTPRHGCGFVDAAYNRRPNRTSRVTHRFLTTADSKLNYNFSVSITVEFQLLFRRESTQFRFRLFSSFNIVSFDTINNVTSLITNVS